MKTYFENRGFIMQIITTVVAIVVIIGIFIWQKNNLNNTSNSNVGETNNASPVMSTVQDVPSITQSDIEQGWYYGDANQKKLNTPDSWLLRDSGTRSAQWYDPNR